MGGVVEEDSIQAATLDLLIQARTFNISVHHTDILIIDFV